MTYIERDDEVLVSLGISPPFRGRVCHIPQATGEWWIIADKTGRLHYIQTFVEIVKLGEEDYE